MVIAKYNMKYNKIPRKIIDRGNGISEVPLTLGRVCLIDTEDKHLVQSYNWQCSRSGEKIYAVRSINLGNKKWRMKRLHRVILSAPETMQVDHINGDKLDNRRCNLRLATNSQNQANINKRKNNTSGYKGVSWCKNSNKWVAHIGINKRRITLGCFSDIQKAVEAYKKAAIKYFGEYARVGI